jgi:hypothetical protein
VVSHHGFAALLIGSGSSDLSFGCDRKHHLPFRPGKADINNTGLICHHEILRSSLLGIVFFCVSEMNSYCGSNSRTVPVQRRLSSTMMPMTAFATSVLTMPSPFYRTPNFVLGGVCRFAYAALP